MFQLKQKSRGNDSHHFIAFNAIRDALLGKLFLIDSMDAD